MADKILLIDDEQDILDLLKSSLTIEGLEVITAHDGNEGIEKFHNKKPDLVVTDIKMPENDGITVLKEIKAQGSDIDVIILTGHSDEVTAIECLKLGAYDYILKPLEDIDILNVTIHRALHKRKLERQNRELLKQLEELSIKDSLTGLYNYRHLQSSLNQEIQRSKRFNKIFCVLMIDIDHFKLINDRYGHQFGDYVLKKLGKLMHQLFRSTDRLFRYGGEEFLAIMPETTLAHSKNAIERIMGGIRAYEFCTDGQHTRITVSIGGAEYPTYSQDSMVLIKQADKNLYRAKELGRDAYVLNFPSFERQDSFEKPKKALSRA